MKLYTREEYLKIHKDNNVSGNVLSIFEGQEVALKDSIVGKLGTGFFNIGKYLVGKIDQRMKLGALRIKSIQYANIIKKALDDALVQYNKESSEEKPSETNSEETPAEETTSETPAEETKETTIEDAGDVDSDIKENTEEFTTSVNKFVNVMSLITTQPNSIKKHVADLKNICNTILKNLKNFKEFTETYNIDNLTEYKKIINLVENIKILIVSNNYDSIKNDKVFTDLNIEKATEEITKVYKNHKLSIPHTPEDKDTNESLYIKEGVITNLGDALSSIDLKKYPKDQKFKDLATSIVDRRALKLISYEAKLIIGGAKKDIDPLDDKLNTFWERQMLLLDKNYTDYIDMDDVRKNVDISTLTDKDKEEAALRMDLVTNVKKTAGHTVIKTAEGLNNVPIVIQVYDYALKSKLYNIVCTSLGVKDGLHWFRMYGTYVYTNGKWIESDLLDKNIKDRAGDKEALFCLESTNISNKPKAMVLFKSNGLILTKIPKTYTDHIGEKIKSYSKLKQISNNYSYILPINISGLFKIDKDAITSYGLSTTGFSSRIEDNNGFTKAQDAAKNTYEAIAEAIKEGE